MYALRDLELPSGVLAGLVEYQENVLVLVNTHSAKWASATENACLGVDRGEDQPKDHPALGRMKP